MLAQKMEDLSVYGFYAFTARAELLGLLIFIDHMKAVTELTTFMILNKRN